MNSVVQWFREQLAEIADLITIDFLSDFEPNINFFNEIFPTAQSYYASFATIGIILTVAIFLFSCFFMLMGIITGYEENPLQMVGRVLLALFATVYAGNIMNYIYEIGNKIADLLADTERLENWGTESGFLDFLTINTTNAILEMILGIVIVWNLIGLILEIMERYLVMCFFWYMSSLANATLASKFTVRIFKTFYSAVIVQVLICALNVWFLRMTTDICIGEITSTGTFTDTLMSGLLIIAWLTVAKRVDQYLKSIGFSVAQTGGSIGRAIWGTVSTISNIASMGEKSAKAVDKFSGTTGFKDIYGKTHETKGNKDVSNAAGIKGGIMEYASDMARNQDVVMATDSTGKAVATVLGDAAKRTIQNSNIPGLSSNSVKQETLNASGMKGKPFQFSYQTTDGAIVSGHVSGMSEENGVKGIKTYSERGVAQYTYFNEGAGLATGTGLQVGETRTVLDANVDTSPLNQDNQNDLNSGAWNQKVLNAIGMENVTMDSRMTLTEQGKITFEDHDGSKFGVVLTSNNKAFNDAKQIGNYYKDPLNGNQYVGIPESKLEGLNVEPNNFANYPGVKDILGENYVVRDEQTLETDGSQSYVCTKEDGSVVNHQFVTADNLDYSKLKTYDKVELPNQGFVYHRETTPVGYGMTKNFNQKNNDKGKDINLSLAKEHNDKSPISYQRSSTMNLDRQTDLNQVELQNKTPNSMNGQNVALEKNGRVNPLKAQSNVVSNMDIQNVPLGKNERTNPLKAQSNVVSSMDIQDVPLGKNKRTNPLNVQSNVLANTFKNSDNLELKKEEDNKLIPRKTKKDKKNARRK